MSRRERKVRLQLEVLEDRATPSGFGQQVAAQAHDPDNIPGVGPGEYRNFGEWQSEQAHLHGGLGEINRAGGPAKTTFN